MTTSKSITSVESFMNTKWRFVVYAGFFVFYAILQISFAKYPVVFCDETDNFYGGLMISQGYELYAGFKTHHMPLLYLLYALIYPVFPHTVTMLRFGGFLLLTLLYLVVFIRYWKQIGFFPALLYPLLFIGFVSAFATSEFLCLTMCSELFEAQGVVILICEYLRYMREERISRSSSVVISLSIVLIFGSVFMGILAVLVVGIAVFVHEIRLWVRAKQENRGSLVRWIFRRNGFLLCAIAVPWVIGALALVVQGNLDKAVFSSYTFNREYYAPYSETPENPLAFLLIGLKALFVPSFEGVTVTPYLVVALIVFYLCNVGFIAYSVFKREWAVALVVFLVIVVLLARGVLVSFHSTPAFALAALLGLSTIENALKCHKGVYIAVTIAVIVCSLWMYSGTYHGVRLNHDDVAGSYPEGCVENLVARYADESDCIFNAVVGADVYLLRDGIPSINGCYFPWFSDAYQLESLQTLKEQAPKVALYDPDLVVFGFNYKDYSKNIADYIEQNYTQVGDQESSIVYVRNDLV